MKVEKPVGWITGLGGTGNVFEISLGAAFLLATIWQDGKFHPLSQAELAAHKASGKADLKEPRTTYLPDDAILKNADGSITVENPENWQRLYVAPVTTTETVIEDVLEFPFSLGFEGKIKINISGISKILNLLN